jgi:hypothetical protein
MVKNCANPKCAKPLHYLREGRIFVFAADSDSDKPIHRMEHFWLCGDCSQTMRLEKARQGVRIVVKPSLSMRQPMHALTQPLAS